MLVTLYSFKLKRELPLLSDDEYRPIEQALAKRVKGIKEYRLQHLVSLEDAKRHSFDDALDYYEKFDGHSFVRSRRSSIGYGFRGTDEYARNAESRLGLREQSFVRSAV